MTWLLLATGLTGGLTLVFVARWLRQALTDAPSVEVYFSPKGGCTEAVVREVGRARREVLVQAYSFSSKPIAQALVEAKTRGVHVTVLLDRSNEAEAYSDLPLLAEQGLAPLIDAHHAIAHNKLMIIDRKTLVTGSFNFTHQAEAENAENLLIVRGHPDLVRTYREQFAAHKAHCQTPQARPAAHHHDRAAA
jgi:phosphatidylserine/phosphatidylglycerophosphate/cardiolipin synthase-like enzyme